LGSERPCSSIDPYDGEACVLSISYFFLDAPAVNEVYVRTLLHVLGRKPNYGTTLYV
jgi:hypothetical protein